MGQVLQILADQRVMEEAAVGAMGVWAVGWVVEEVDRKQKQNTNSRIAGAEDVAEAKHKKLRRNQQSSSYERGEMMGAGDEKWRI